MYESRERIADDLRGMLAGKLLCEPLERAPYAVDASLYEIDPLGVVVPRTEDDVAAVVRYANERGIPLHARGAGTSRAGETLGPGLVIDFSRHFRRILEIGPESVVVQPGVVIDELNAQLAPLGRRLGPNPFRSGTGTIGGMIGVDAVGSRSLRYGSAGDHVERLRVVFATGEVGEVGREPWPSFDDEPGDFKESVVRKLGALVRHNAELIARKGPKVPRNRAGFALKKAATSEGIDLARLLAGSEGTLALVTRAVVRTVPVPAAQGVVLLPFGRLGDAASAVGECLPLLPSSCDLYDWRSLRLVRDTAPGFRDWIAEAAESALVVEFEGDDPDQVAYGVRLLSKRLVRSGMLVAEPVAVFRRAECEQLLSLRRHAEPLLMRMKGGARPVPLIDDISVPPALLPDFLQRLQNILKQHDVSWTLDAHAGEGHLRARPFLDPGDPKDVAKLEPLATDVAEAVREVGGSISGGSGCGLLRTQFLRAQFGELERVYRGVKDAFDPFGILNPGKVLGDDPHLMTRHLRRVAPSSTSDRVGDEPAPAPTSNGSFLPVLRWPQRGPLEIASACHGCGDCRTQEPTLRMCPMFRALRSEAATPRTKANLLRQMAAGEVDPRLWGTEELKANADLCIHCELCRSECPSGLDISSLMLEAKAAYVQNHGLTPTDWFFSRLESWSRIGARLPIVSNALLRSGPARWLLERMFGISRLRRLPRFHRTPFVSRAARLGLTKARPHAPGPRIAYFVDVFANYYDQELAESVVAVLRQAEVNVFVPAGQRGSGMAALCAGDIDLARDLALRNLKILGNAVRDGYTVVCSEPTAALMLREGYLKLTDDLDAALVAENTRDLGQYLAGLDARGLLPHPTEAIHARVGYHQPCHLRALGAGTPGLDLIRSIPELDVHFIDRGCSGMAGTFGLARDHFLTSLRAGRGLLSRLKEPDLDLGATECAACRLQMEQGLTKRTLHPVKLLSLGYGLNPTLRQQLRESKDKHVIS